MAQAAAYFVSHDMSKSGEIYSVGGGRVSCISYINNDGYFDRELTPEIVELSGTDMLHELRGACQFVDGGEFALHKVAAQDWRASWHPVAERY